VFRGLIVTLAGHGRFSMHLSPILLDETRDALFSARQTKAYGHDASNVLAWLAELREIGAVFQRLLPDIGPARRDPDDGYAIAMAVAVGADAIVIGDRDLLARGSYGAASSIQRPNVILVIPSALLERHDCLNVADPAGLHRGLGHELD
jgi:predicted nucleic acid-binding protein